ncbi:MAG TPA: DUF4082 domain-containing protein, partial [Enterovirga sp.]
MIPSSACPPWQPDRSGPKPGHRRERRSVTPRLGARSVSIRAPRTWPRTSEVFGPRTEPFLASVIFANETASGWQQASFSTLVPITAGAVYVASYHTTAGRYAADPGFF